MDDAPLRRPVSPVAAQMAADEGLGALSRSLSDPDPHTRALALDVICEFSQERAARLLTAFLQDPEPSLRCAAAAAAGRVGAPSVVFSLISILDDADPRVREAAVAAIARLTGKAVRLADARERRLEQIEELARWWKQERLAKLLARIDGECDS
jgi:HEAT repeat protein